MYEITNIIVPALALAPALCALHSRRLSSWRCETRAKGISMADSTDKLARNVDGIFYVDSQCIDCDLCRQTAPENFERNEDEGFTFVNKQPDGDEEEQAMRDAIEECPVEAIGDDG